jgi:hypothetical protein
MITSLSSILSPPAHVLLFLSSPRAADTVAMAAASSRHSRAPEAPLSSLRSPHVRIIPPHQSD